LLIQKKASGKNKGLATERAKKIVYNIRQTDNHLYVENGFFINQNESFRMQQVTLLLTVPVGKNIVLPTARNIIHEYPNESEFRDFFTDPAEKTVYTMTPNGLIEKK
jgi:hypothetical protein